MRKELRLGAPFSLPFLLRILFPSSLFEDLRRWELALSPFFPFRVGGEGAFFFSKSFLPSLDENAGLPFFSFFFFFLNRRGAVALSRSSFPEVNGRRYIRPFFFLSE